MSWAFCKCIILWLSCVELSESRPPTLLLWLFSLFHCYHSNELSHSFSPNFYPSLYALSAYCRIDCVESEIFMLLNLKYCCVLETGAYWRLLNVLKTGGGLSMEAVRWAFCSFIASFLDVIQDCWYLPRFLTGVIPNNWYVSEDQRSVTPAWKLWPAWKRLLRGDWVPISFLRLEDCIHAAEDWYIMLWPICHILCCDICDYIDCVVIV